MNFGIHDTECPPQSYDKASAAFFSLERSHFRFRYVENDYLWGDWGLAAAHRDHTCPLHKGQDFDAERDNSVDEFDDGGHDTVLVWYGFTDERDTCDGEESPDGYWAIIEVVAH